MTTKAQKKLVLNKETLRNLKDSELGGVAGGLPPPTGTSCTPTNCYYPDTTAGGGNTLAWSDFCQATTAIC
jgi:hypothetical protein